MVLVYVGWVISGLTEAQLTTDASRGGELDILLVMGTPPRLDIPNILIAITVSNFFYNITQDESIFDAIKGYQY